MDTINEIKIYREHIDCSLKEAHEIINKHGSAKKALKAAGVKIKKKTKYKEIKKKLKTLDQDFFTGSVEDTIKALENFEAEHPGFYNFKLEIEDGWGDYRVDYVLFGIRKETDQERDKRLAKAKRLRIAQKKRREKEAKDKEIRERKQYEKLKAKFEKED